MKLLLHQYQSDSFEKVQYQQQLKYHQMVSDQGQAEHGLKVPFVL